MKKLYALLLMLIISTFASQKMYAQNPTPWDGSKIDVTIENADAVVKYEFTATKAGSFTFISDTKSIELKIKINGTWSNTLYSSWAGATITVDDVKVDEKLILEISAATEPSFPVVLPLELKVEEPSHEYTPWDGTPLDVSIEKPEDIKYYTYTNNTGKRVMFYLMCTSDMHNAIFEGHVNKEPFEATDYDNNYGGYAQFQMAPGEVLKFSVQSTNLVAGAFAARTITISPKIVTMNGFNQPGHHFETPTELTLDTQFDVLVNAATADVTEYTGITTEKTTWLTFTPSVSGIANFDSEIYDIYVMKESEFSNPPAKPRHIIQDKVNNDHLFSVEAGQKYVICVPNPRPLTATLKLTAADLGGDCQLPIEFTGSSKMNVKNGELWYKYNFGDKNYLEITSSTEWAGSITLVRFCNDERPITITKKAGESLAYYNPITKDEYNTSFLININGNADITDGITLTERDATTGESCEHSEAINVGTTSFGGINRPYFMHYVATKDCMMTLEIANGSLNVIGTECGTQSVPYTSITGGIQFRVTDGLTYYFDVNGQSTEGTMKLTELNITPGEFCDFPILENSSNNIELGNVVGSGFITKFFSFTEAKSGVRTFSAYDANIIIDEGWTLIVRTECDQPGIPVSKILKKGEVSFIEYSFHVEAGKTYTAEFIQYKSANDLVLFTSFRDTKDGDNCDRPINMTLGTEKAIAYSKLPTWYKVNIDQAGFYAISGLVGAGGNIYSRSSCTDTPVNIPNTDDGWASGKKYAKVYFENPTDLFLETLITTDSTNVTYTVKVEFIGAPAPGELCSNALAATPNQEYSLPAVNADRWYKYTIQPNETVIFKNVGSFFPTFEFYPTCGETAIEPTSDTYFIDNANKGRTHTLPAVITATEYLIKVPASLASFSFKVETNRPSSADKVTVAAAKIYPNPSNGVFTINVPKLTNNAKAIVRNIVGAQIATVLLTDTETTVDLGSIAAGNYIVTVINGETSSSHQLIIK